MEPSKYTVYFVNLDTGVLVSQQVLALDVYGARRNFMRRLRGYEIESGQRYRVDVAIGWKPLNEFPTWMSDPARVYQTAR